MKRSKSPLWGKFIDPAKGKQGVFDQFVAPVTCVASHSCTGEKLAKGNCIDKYKDKEEKAKKEDTRVYRSSQRKQGVGKKKIVAQLAKGNTQH